MENNLERLKTAAASPADTPGRLDCIDGLRGLAMLMVLFFHCAYYSDGWRVPGNLLAFTQYGYLGVNLFLVLSGFCLYWPFVKSGARREPTLWEFAKKRCRRILPPYYVSLLLFWLFLLWDSLTHHHFHQDADSKVHVFKSLFWHLAMLQNLRPEYIFSINGPYWSLGLESSLYVLFPILVFAFRRFGLLRPLMALLLVNLLFRQALLLWCPSQLLTGNEEYVLYFSVFGRGFEFGLGMLAAVLLAKREPRVDRYSGYVCLFSGIAASVITGRFGMFGTATDAAWGVCFASLIVTSHAWPVARRVFSRPVLVRLGVFSYSVYLIHQPIVKALDEVAMRHHWPTVAFGLLVIVPGVLLLGYVFHVLFERPFMNSPRTHPVPAPSRPANPIPVLAPMGE